MRNSLFIFVLYALISYGFVMQQENSTIKGRVTIKSSIEAKKPGGLSALYSSQKDEHKKREPSGKIEAVIFISDDIQDNWTLPLETPEVKQMNEEFVPHVLAIRVGTTVDFPNYDKIYHNVFSFSKTKSFDLGRYAKGKSKSVNFDKTGIVQVFCEIHSFMHAYILVLPNKYYAKSSPDGIYLITGIPAGEYNLTARHESFPEQTKKIKIGNAETLTVNFEF